MCVVCVYIYIYLSIYIYIYIPHLLYPFICWWALRLLPYLGYYVWCCNEYSGAYYMLESLFMFSLDKPRHGIAGSYDTSIFNFMRNLHIVFCRGCTSLQFYQQCMTFPFFPTSSPMLFICFLFDSSHSDRCEVISHHGFNLYSLMISDVEHLFMYLYVSF